MFPMRLPEIHANESDELYTVPEKMMELRKLPVGSAPNIFKEWGFVLLDKNGEHDTDAVILLASLVYIMTPREYVINSEKYELEVASENKYGPDLIINIEVLALKSFLRTDKVIPALKSLQQKEYLDFFISKYGENMLVIRIDPEKILNDVANPRPRIIRDKKGNEVHHSTFKDFSLKVKNLKESTMNTYENDK